MLFKGLAVSMEATALPALVIVIGIIATIQTCRLYGIAISVTSYAFFSRYGSST